MKTLRKIILSQRKNFLYLLTKKKEKKRKITSCLKKADFRPKEEFPVFIYFPKNKWVFKTKNKNSHPLETLGFSSNDHISYILLKNYKFFKWKSFLKNRISIKRRYLPKRNQFFKLKDIIHPQEKSNDFPAKQNISHTYLKMISFSNKKTSQNIFSIPLLSPASLFF